MSMLWTTKKLDDFRKSLRLTATSHKKKVGEMLKQREEEQ